MNGTRRRSLSSFALAALLLLGLSYSLPRLLPGDYLSAAWSGSGIGLSEAAASYWQQQLAEQGFFAYLFDLLRGDWGTSYSYAVPVSQLIGEAFIWSLLLLGSAHLLATLGGFVIGVEIAWRHGSPLERLSVAGTSLLEGIPELASGILLLLIFSLQLGWLPAAGATTAYAELSGWPLLADHLRHLLLPLLTLVLAYLPGSVLLTRSSMLLVLGSAYLTTARAKGLPPLRIRYAHAARNALLPLVTRFGLRLAVLLTGALVVESLFAYPGLGSLLFNAIGQRDLPLIRGIVLFSSLLVLSINLLLELLYRRLDPRLQDG